MGRQQLLPGQHLSWHVWHRRTRNDHKIGVSDAVPDGRVGSAEVVGGDGSVGDDGGWMLGISSFQTLNDQVVRC